MQASKRRKEAATAKADPSKKKRRVSFGKAYVRAIDPRPLGNEPSSSDEDEELMWEGEGEGEDEEDIEGDDGLEVEEEGFDDGSDEEEGGLGVDLDADSEDDEEADMEGAKQSDSDQDSDQQEGGDEEEEEEEEDVEEGGEEEMALPLFAQRQGGQDEDSSDGEGEDEEDEEGDEMDDDDEFNEFGDEDEDGDDDEEVKGSGFNNILKGILTRDIKDGQGPILAQRPALLRKVEDQIKEGKIESAERQAKKEYLQQDHMTALEHDPVFEKNLVRIATRGVVQFFTAVAKQNMAAAKSLPSSKIRPDDNGEEGEEEEEEAKKAVSKAGLLDAIKAPAKKGEPKKEESKGKGAAWMKDDYATGGGEAWDDQDSDDSD